MIEFKVGEIVYLTGMCDCTMVELFGTNTPAIITSVDNRSNGEIKYTIKFDSDICSWNVTPGEIVAFTRTLKLKCECGMEKHGFANHSRWCPKHE